MTDMLVTMKFMPESPEVDLDAIKAKASELITAKEGTMAKDELEPIAFGLKALKLTFTIDETKDLDPIEEEVSGIEGVNSVQIVDMRRTLG